MPTPSRAGLAAALLLTTAAGAQTIALNFPGSTVTTQNNGPGTCNNNLIVAWTSSGLTSANTCNSLQVWVTNSTSCSDSPGTSGSDGGTDVIIGTFSLATQTSGATPAVALSTIPGLVGVDCANAIVDVKNAICSSVQLRSTVGGTCSVIQATPSLIVRYDTQPPDPPSVGLTPQDSRIIVALTATGSQASDILTFNVDYARMFDDGGVDPFTTITNINSNSGSGRLTINNLVNENTYLVRGYALDEVGNISQPSAIQSAIPEASDGFWATYKKDGGEEMGGCNAAGAAVPSAIALVAALVALFRRRR